MFYRQGNQIRSKPARRATLGHGDKGDVGLILTDLPTRIAYPMLRQEWPPFCDWALVL